MIGVEDKEQIEIDEKATVEAQVDVGDSDQNLSGENADDQNSVPETADFSNWYTLRVVSGKEKFVKENVFRELEFSPSLKSKIKEIFVPFEKNCRNQE